VQVADEVMKHQINAAAKNANDGRGSQLSSILISSASVPEDLICVGEQEPNPVRRDGNQDDRKDKTR
jgi:hypothetical protein